MATLEQLSSALVNADAAGDVEAARVLASEIRKLRSTAPESDQYKGAAKKEYDELKARGVPVEPSYARRAAQGMTFGAADEILAAAKTPIEMVRRGIINPAEGYRHAKAWEDVTMDEARKNQGILGHAAEIGGGVGSGVGLARSGVSLVRNGTGLLGRSLGLGAEGAAYGGAQGFLDGGNSLQERMSGALSGAAVGGAVGAGLPVAGTVLGTVAAPIVSNIRARTNPTGAAASQVARAVDESGRPIQDIVSDVTTAAGEGQPVYTIADALGNPGQRMLATVSRTPGAGRTQAVDFLDSRQAGQSRRVANTLAEGFDAPQTAQQTEARLTGQRSTEAEANYGAARAQAGNVNVTPAIEAIDANLQPGVTRLMSPQTNIADNSVEGALRRARSYLSDGRSQVNDFNGAFMAKRELDAMIETASPTVQRAIIPVRNALDDQLAAASAPYRAARDRFREQSQAIEAVEQGRTAAQRGRTEDTIPAFQGMRPDQQAAYRAGYVDPLIGQAQGSAFGVNAARPLTSDAFRMEAQAIAPGNPLMQRRLGRENRMFETRNHAVGNSRTADNLADEGALRTDPSIVMALLSGNIGSAAQRGLAHASNALHGNTPAVREHIANLLLQRGAAPTIERDISQEMARLARNSEIARALARSATSGSGITYQRSR